MKYCLCPMDFQKAQAIFHFIPRLKSQYSQSRLRLLANIFLYYLRELAIFFVLASSGLSHGSFKSLLGNTLY